MKKWFSLIILTVLISPAFGQSKSFPATIGIMGGLTEYNGDLGQSVYTFSHAKPFAGVAFGYYVTPHLDFNINTSFGSLAYAEPHNLKFDSKLWQASTHFRIKILSAEKYKVVPYLLAGIGMARYSKHKLETTDGGVIVPGSNGNGTDMFLAFGAGAKYQLTERLHVYLQEKFALTDHDFRDGEERNTNDAFAMHTIGLSYDFSLDHDADHDGVADKKDKCKNTPAGVKVDTHGCPLDRDGDGIADYLDACPDVKGMVTAKGCPDADGDSIADSEDKCPDVYGLASMQGCPDKDRDGITDKDDSCPDLPGTLAMHGCPDQDNDGIADPDDACPTEKGSAAMKGCPDRDNDGIPDKDDKCPDVAGIAANKGCPEVKEEVKKVLATALQGIQFETGKDIIRSSSFPILNNVVKVMNENPEYKLSIEGHTDNVGDPAKNLDLSNRRANAVMKYLTGKKIDASRLRAKGFGDTTPVDTNATPAGRAKNRRVEFKVEF